MEQHPINEIMKVTIEQVREMVDANTIIGEPIECGEIVLIPVSKISIGLGTGGADIPSKHQVAGKNLPFGGGGGAGIKVEPVAFISVNGSNVKVLPMTVIPAETTVDRIIEALPEVVDRVTEFIEKRSKDKEEKDSKPNLG